MPYYHSEILTPGSVILQSNVMKKSLLLYDFLSSDNIIFDSIIIIYYSNMLVRMGRYS